MLYFLVFIVMSYDLNALHHLLSVSFERHHFKTNHIYPMNLMYFSQIFDEIDVFSILLPIIFL